MDYASNHLVTLGVVFFLSLFPLLFAFISRIQRTKIQGERDTALTELKQKYAPVTDAEAASILADTNNVRVHADYFTKLRKSLGLTQVQFEKKLRMSVAMLGHWERGDRTPQGPALALLNVLAKEPEAGDTGVRVI